jgi:hypothetical protein
MSLINGSVGEKGKNDPRDVKTVQRLLNKHTIPPLRPLSVDGFAGKNTIDAIRQFQTVVMEMRHPDGRVDPGGKTIRRLNRGTDPEPSPKKEPLAEKKKPTAQSRKADREKRRKFVDPRVKEIAITTKIIDYIMPHFEGVDATVISGYLNDSDLFWKVNYHWEYLKWMIEHSQTLDISVKHKDNLRAINSALLSNKPDPDTGYRTSGKVGVPTDKSSMDKMDKRYKIVRQSKRDFKKVIIAAELKKKSSRSAKSFDLAAAPVAHPGTSRHSTGYALDIGGNNSQIVSICKKLGATLTFDEQSHVHVEFKNGVPS